MLPDDLVGSDHGCTDRCRRQKWAGMRFLHNLVHQPPYRYHSLACALEATPGQGCTVSKAAFVARMMAAYRFDRKLRMDTRLRSLYECYEGARADAVDYRDILCCTIVLRRFKDIRDNPRKLFRDLILLYSDDEGEVVRRQDALRVMRIGALHGGHILQTSTRLDKYLAEEARPRGLKPTFRDLDITCLMDTIEANPSILVAFRTQLWQRIPEAWRLGVLQAVEAMGFEKASSGAMAMKERRAVRWYTKTLSRRIIVGWKVFRNRAKQIRAQRERIQNVRRRQTLRAWHASAAIHVLRRKRRGVADQYGRICTLRRYFYSIVKYVEVNKRLAAVAWKFSKQGKLVMAGVGLLRGVLRKRSMRLALQAWCETASLMNAWGFAVDLAGERLCRRVFAALRDTVRAAVVARRADDEAEMRAAAVAESIEEAERERVLLAELAEERKKRQKAEEKAALMVRRAAEHVEKIEAARAGSVARDTEVLQRQREARRRRVYENRVKVKNDFDAAWEVKLRETVEREMELAREWLESDPEAPFKVQKEMKILKRKFYAAPLPETAELERALRDPANYIFAHMANLIYKENKTLQMFFNQFDKEGDGYLTHEEFKGMVSSLNVKLSREQIRSVIRTIDLDGGGFIDFPEFEAAVKRHEEVCGQAGSVWKMYVSPVHAIMTFHNVETNEMLWDYKATEKDLLRVVKDNIVGLEGIEAKKRAVEDREKDWEELLRNRAATTMQRQYHAWAARKRRALLRWKWDVEKARAKNRETTLMATRIQCWWRILRAKWLALQLLQITIEVLWDPGLNQQYYFNHGLGQAAWEVPSMLRRWRGRGAKMPSVPEWVFISRLFGQSYFYNTRSRLRQNEKPAGYLRCSSCQTQLASRRCTVEERDLCFVCFRGEHLEGEERLWHNWETSKAFTCQVCAQRDATLVCAECPDKGPESRGGKRGK
ncbi:unnamed protein product, partial [Ectocarpus sp. 6 AP-2014]